MVEAFQDHFGGQDESPQAYTRWVEDPLMDVELLVVAFDGDQVAAAVQGAIDPAENEANGYLRGWTDPVFTRRANGEARIYINGEAVARSKIPGDFSNWNTSYRLALGNEARTNERPWLGTFHDVALYHEALSAKQVRAHYATGRAARGAK